MHYDCVNRNSFGYCKTTVCINEHYRHEEWASTSNRTERAVVNPKTNADKIRAMTDEELAEWMRDIMSGWCPKRTSLCDGNCKKCTLDWLRQEESDG